jgi:RHS repeat-associated protein
VCTAGICAGVDHCVGVTCTALDQCHVAGTCIDHATGACSNPAKPNGTSCDDGNANTTSDVCTNGICAGVDHCVGVTCTAQDQCHVVGTCIDHATGACSNPAKADGTACNDGNACTRSDTCQAGACVGGNPVTCPGSDPCRVGAACNPSTGQCSAPCTTDISVGLQSMGAVASASDSYTTNPPSTINDGVASTSANGWGNAGGTDSRLMIRLARVYAVSKLNIFWGGNNLGGWGAGTNTNLPTQYTVQVTSDPTALATDATTSTKWISLSASGNQLSASYGTVSGTHVLPGFVNASWGTSQSVTFTPVAAIAIRLVFDGSPASKSNNWVGQVGELDVRALSPACTVPDGTTCGGDTPCAVSFTCTSGICSGVSRPSGDSCTDGNPCNGMEMCDGAGHCKPGVPLADGTACSGDVCTPRACEAGQCVAGSPERDGTPCSDGSLCLAGATCLAGACNASANDGASCSDGDACNGAETCNGGTCVRGTPVAPLSPHGDPCRSDLCDPVTGAITQVTCSPINPTAPTDLAQAADFIVAQQPGAAIDPKRICVLRGQVVDTDGSALPNVTLSVAGDASPGVARTRLDGHFDYAINGGGEISLRYTKPGYKPVQRFVVCSWKDYAQAPDVVMTRLDPAVTSIALGSSSFQVARGSFVQDADGMRRATILVPPHTGASFVFPDGSQTPYAGELSVRATEFTVGPNGPKAMPGALPATSGYTYAVDLSADEAIAVGATKAVFTDAANPAQPASVILYVENFIGFPVSSIVPTGEFDASACAWRPTQNGRVVKILSITDGVAQLATQLDATGQPVHSDADEAALGITNGERAELAQLYVADQTLWRAPVSQLVDPDCNWAINLPPDYCRPDDAHCQGSAPTPAPTPRDGCRAGAIACESQTLCESVPVTGTSYQLSYASDRVPGRKEKYSLSIPLVGAAVPASVKRVELRVEVAGQVFERTFACPCNGLAPYEFQWDGKDGFGRTVQGSQPVEVAVSYVYPTRYADTAQGTLFGAYASSTGPIQTYGYAGLRSTSEMRVYRVWHGVLGTWNQQGSGLGGWDFDNHHTYDLAGRMLYRGDCTRRELQQVTSTLVGGGPSNSPLTSNCGSPGSVYASPLSVVAMNDGSVVWADWAGSTGTVRKVTPCGAVSVLASIYGAKAVARGCEGCDGGVYVSSNTTYQVFRIDPLNHVTVVAGTGTACTSYSASCGDGGPATAAQLRNPAALSVGPDGTLYIADGNRIRRVGLDGIITTIAGTVGCFQSGVLAAPDGNVYFSAGGCSGGPSFIFVIKPNGVIEPVVGALGCGRDHYDSYGVPLDGFAALDTCLTWPTSLALSKDGLLTFADDNRVRQVGKDGVVRTVAGIDYREAACYGYCGDGVPATSTYIGQDSAVAFAPDGSLLVGGHTGYVDRIVRVDNPLPRFADGSFTLPSADASEVYTFDTTGRHLTTKDALTGALKYTFGYDGLGRLSSVTYAPGSSHVTTIAYGTGTATITSPFGDVTTLALDSFGNLSSISRQGGPPSAPRLEAYTLASTPDGLLSSFAFPDDHAYTLAYDPSTGRLASVADPAGGNQILSQSVVGSAYKPDSTVTRSTTADLGSYAQSYEVAYDSKGSEVRTTRFPTASNAATTTIGTDGMQAITLPDGTTITATLSPDPRYGLLAATTSTTTKLPLGGLSRAELVSRSYDAQKRLNQVDTVNGKTWSKLYDPAARTITWTTPAGRTRVTQLDAAGRMVSETVLGQGSTSFGYSPDYGQVLTTTRTALGELPRVSQNVWYAPGAGLGMAGNLAAAIDPLANSTTFDAYDLAGRVTHQTLAGGRTVAFAYDAVGNRLEVVPPAATPTYGSADLLQTRQLFGYTLVGQLGSYQVIDAAHGGAAVEMTTYGYTPDRLLKAMVRPEGDQVAYATSLGRTNDITLPSGETVHYAYDAATGRLASIAGPSAGVSLAFGYNGPLVTNVTWSGLGAGVTLQRAFDNDFRVASETAQGLTLYFGYDADGLVQCVGSAQTTNCAGQLAIARTAGTTVLSGTAFGAIVESYSANGFGEPVHYNATVGAQSVYRVDVARDALGRISTRSETLLNADGTTSSASLAYTYDAAGRLTDVVTASGTHHYDYDLSGNVLRRTTGGGETLGSYGLGDRLQSWNGTTYTYTASGHLQTATNASGSTTYGYDALGNLRTVALPDGTNIAYIIDGQNRRIGKTVTGKLVKAWLYADQVRIAAEVSFDLAGNVSSTKRFGYGSKTNVPDLMVTQDGARYRILSDALGSPRSVVSESGTITARMDYDELGRAVVNTQPGLLPFGYAGGLADPDTGLVRLGARDYDPTLGRWTAKQAPRPDDMSVDGYAVADPINWQAPQAAPAANASADLSQLVCSNSAGASNAPASGTAAVSAGGSCPALLCDPGAGDCDGNTCNGCETDLTASLSNCGACGYACPAFPNAAVACVDGACSFTCADGFGNCDLVAANGCETSLTTDANCGSCGHTCAAPNAALSCVNGACVGKCIAGFGDCDGIAANGCETNVTTVTNCGGCGYTCTTVNGTPACASGICTIGSCNAGFADCDTDPFNGCEADLRAVTSCGACGVVCSAANGTPACVGGACAVSSCNVGFADCDGNAANGCEVDLATSGANCGACGRACAAIANGAPACVAGACTVGGCDSGYGNCDGNAANGCETDLTTSASNCGACGHACMAANGTAACVGGACAVGSCNAGFADCDGNAANGCETNLKTSGANCGSCGHVCPVAANMTAGCAGGVCGPAACNAGFGDCDMNPVNGCETDLTTSAAHCGACGTPCEGGPHATAACVGGACALNCAAGYNDCDGNPANGCETRGMCGCPAGFGDCDGNPANGCETALDANPNCGACGFTCNGGCTGGTCVPSVSFVGIADDAVVTKPTPIQGTVSDGTWKLEVRLGGRDDVDTPYTLLASGEAPASGTLATLDPTLLLNGLYTLRLTATTPTSETSKSIAVAVDGRMKIGNFTLSFTDLDMPVGGLPIQLVRTYDSRDKSLGDFGVGWNLDIRNVRVEKAGKTGALWQHIYIPDDFFPQWCLEPAASLAVTLTFPGGRQYRFRPKSQPECQTLNPIDTPDIVWVSDSDPDNPTVKLVADGSTAVVVEGPHPGAVRLRDSDFQIWDPKHFTLTVEDGTVYDVLQGVGVTYLQNRNGETLTISDNGLVHSSGKSVPFVRDASGRITSITDPSGNAMTYAYSAAGDLATYTDREANATTFTYAGDHYLQDIYDPLGRRPIRNEYDAEGRLQKHIDAAGHEVVYTHDVGSQVEQVVDRLGNLTVYEYNDLGDVTRKTDALGKVWSSTYDRRGNQTSAMDPLGHVTTSTYDPADNLLTRTDPLQHTTTYTYNTFKQVLTTMDPRGYVTTNLYDSRGNLLKTTDALTHATTHTYDLNTGYELTRKDAADAVTSFTYDHAGNVATETDGLGHVTSYTYDASNRKLSETRTRTVNGAVETLTTSYAYDKLGRATVTTFPDGSAQQTTYTATGKVASRVDELGHVTSYEYDEQGRLVVTRRPDGTTLQLAYDAEGRRTSSTDAAGRATTFIYDPVGRLTTTTHPDGSFLETRYDDAGRAYARRDELGHWTQFELDDAGRMTGKTDPIGALTTYDYDEADHLTTETDPLLQATTHVYDEVGREVGQAYADGTSTQTWYDAAGRMVTKADELGRVTQFGYDALGRLVWVTDALDQTTQYSYDEAGNRITQTDANGHTTTFTYDVRGREVRRTLPDGAFETKVYDDAGRVVSRIDFERRATSYVVDPLGRVLSRTYPDGTSVGFTYTPTGRRATVTDARGTTTYLYDVRDRLETLTYPEGRVLSMAYDPTGRRTGLTAVANQASLTTTTIYDIAGRPSVVIDPLGRTFQLTHDPGGRRQQIAYPNGTTTAYGYDSRNRLTSLTTVAGTQTVQGYTYKVDNAGRRMSITEADGTVRQYGYDDIDRLTSESVTGPLSYVKTFNYDPVGNRLAQVTTGVGASSIAYVYDARDRLTTENGTTYGYDANGNLISKSGEATYTWDYDNRLTNLGMAAGPAVVHEYDADGNRVQTSVTSRDTTTTTNMLVDTVGLSQVVAETDEGGALTALYVRVGDELLEVMRPAGNGGWTTRFVHHDALGSVRALTDEGGAVADTRAYEAFGTMSARSGSDPLAYGFAGESFEGTSGLAYHRARWMDPRVGRFVGQDPAGGAVSRPVTFHKYLYAGDTPINATDASGRDYTLAGAAAVGADIGILAGMANYVTYRSGLLRPAAFCKYCYDPIGNGERPNGAILTHGQIQKHIWTRSQVQQQLDRYACDLAESQGAAWSIMLERHKANALYDFLVNAQGTLFDIPTMWVSRPKDYGNFIAGFAAGFLNDLVTYETTRVAGSAFGIFDDRDENSVEPQDVPTWRYLGDDESSVKFIDAGWVYGRAERLHFR